MNISNSLKHPKFHLLHPFYTISRSTRQSLPFCMQMSCSLWPHLPGVDLTAQFCQGHSFTLQRWVRCGFRAGHSRKGFTHAWVLVGRLTLPDTTLHSSLPYHPQVSGRTLLLPQDIQSPRTHSVASFTSRSWVNEYQRIPPFQLCFPLLFSIPVHAPTFSELKTTKIPFVTCIHTWNFVENFAKWTFYSTESQPVITASIHLHWFISTVLKS